MKDHQGYQPLCITSWNVRTMLTRLGEDLQIVSDTHQTAVIDLELHRLNAEIAAPWQTRLLDSRSLKEVHYTIFW